MPIATMSGSLASWTTDLASNSPPLESETRSPVEQDTGPCHKLRPKPWHELIGAVSTESAVDPVLGADSAKQNQASWGTQLLEKLASLGLTDEEVPTIQVVKGGSRAYVPTLPVLDDEACKEEREDALEQSIIAEKNTEGSDSPRVTSRDSDSDSDLQNLHLGESSSSVIQEEKKGRLGTSSLPQAVNRIRTRRYSTQKTNKEDDRDWKRIQQIIKEKGILTNSGVRNIVLESMKEAPRNLMDPHTADNSEEVDPQMVKMAEYLERFNATETERHSMDGSAKGFLKRAFERLIADLSEEAVPIP